MIGDKILHYKIGEKLGEGGMGIVYLAEDTKLDRKVAIKFLPDHISPNSDERQRFEIEAKAASALNHPNVCAIHDILEHNDRVFMVMEYVDGQLLRERINSQTFTLKNAIETGIQIAEGLSAAHEKGIFHRDIKPENIVVSKDGRVQILDFGLAKFRGISKLTKEGSTVGTAGYMSPEQVQGIESDHRSDIFSLGVVLYELLTGQMPFHGVHEAALTYEIINVDPALPSSLKSDIEPELDRILLECLEKDPNERTQSVKQVAIDLRRALRESGRQRVSKISKARPVATIDSQPVSEDNTIPVKSVPNTIRSIRWLFIPAAVLIGLVLGYGMTQLILPTSTQTPVIRASIEMPSGATYSEVAGGNSCISPDGTMIAFVASDSLSERGLWVRRLQDEESELLPGTKNATYPFWSPASNAIGFFSDGRLKTVDITSRLILTLADAPFGRGGAWSRNGEIIFSPTVTDFDLYAVSVSGGIPRKVTSFDSTEQYAPRFPFFLPDGNHFLFSRLEMQTNNNESDIYIGSLDNPRSQKILQDGAYGQFASGHLLFFRQKVLLAQPFDLQSFTLKDQAFPLQANINFWSARAKTDFSVSENGILVFAGNKGEQAGKLVWINSDGIENSITPIQLYRSASLSPDGKHVAYDQFDAKLGEPFIWIYDTFSKSKLRLTLSLDGGSMPCWSRDGKKLYYNVEVGGTKSNIFVYQYDGTRKQEFLARGEAGDEVSYYPLDVSTDGKYLLIAMWNESKSELATIDLLHTQRPIPIVKLGIIGSRGRFSPDGKWIVYQSDESGASEIFVSSFKGSTGKWQLSVSGGIHPLWVNDRIIYYSPAINRFDYINVTFSTQSPTFSQSRSLFPSGRSQNNFIYGSSSEGRQYLGFKPMNSQSSGSLSLIVNWGELVIRN